MLEAGPLREAHPTAYSFLTKAPKLPHGLTRKGSRRARSSTMSPFGLIAFKFELIRPASKCASRFAAAVGFGTKCQIETSALATPTAAFAAPHKMLDLALGKRLTLYVDALGRVDELWIDEILRFPR